MEVAIDHDRVCLETLDSAAISGAAAASRSRFPDFSKRTLDIVLSVVMIVFLTPLLAATAIAIKLDSPGPVLYRQKRVGLGGKVFEVYKFRSMFVDAERDGPQYARIGDERITRVGRIIRRLRIDEIPQTLNVLNGKMSFVGPRPERPEFVATLEKEIPHYHARHLVKPGITGWAQVKYEYAASVEGAREKLRYDLYYVTAVSPLLDLAIVAMTVRVVLFGLGSR
ncbi:MAG: exopolysaccharide biosynthesis polyprenyl glycosylphosphotransferase [Pseudomonadota bacterium]